MSYEKFDAFAHMGDGDERLLTAKQQKTLIKKLQDEVITENEKDVLMGSLYNLVIGVARSFHSRFPDRSLEDLIEDGLLNLWLRLPKYNSEKSKPSTYSQIVVSSAFCKELKKLQRRSIRRTICCEETGEEKEINIPCMSLNNFLNDEGEEYEPDILGVQDDHQEQISSVIDFEETVLAMFKDVCNTVQEYKILNHILNTKILPNYGGGRRRKSLNKIAEIADTKMSHVEKVAKCVIPWLKKIDFLELVDSHNLQAPMADAIFSKEILDEYFTQNPGEDLWSLRNGNVE
jgi:RNA polymerase sigma factor (sigma-70 family)